ncbi:MAG: polymer-forming cytoskeletal protein [Ignavibacterium sp.]|nr:polymer-forming cytoskeletal protein [Ignavibacterium sp.]MDW8375537.1 polymer-forming cytoskeletal protein [Ignavibacteriales bacterium]
MKVKNNGNIMDDVTIISNGVSIEGRINSKGNIRIDGMIKGDVSAQGNLTIGESGQVQGNISGQNIIIGGRVEGTATANERITLQSKSFLKGDLITKILIVESGAIFDGKSSMTSLNNLSDEQSK